MEVSILDGNGCSHSSAHALVSVFGEMDIVKRVRIVNIDDNKLAKRLKDLVVIPGGEPKCLMRELGKNKRCILKEYVKQGGKLIGICGGACLIVQMNFFTNKIRLVNDNIWANCGISASVQAKMFLPSEEAAEPDQQSYISGRVYYENGPLFRFRKKKAVHDDITVRAEYVGDAALEHMQAIGFLQSIVSTESVDWVCKSCAFRNPPGKSKCSRCKEKKTHKLPPVDEMPGTIAAIRLDESIYITSFHPEFSCVSVRQWFQEEITRFTCH